MKKITSKIFLLLASFGLLASCGESSIIDSQSEEPSISTTESSEEPSEDPSSVSEAPDLTIPVGDNAVAVADPGTMYKTLGTGVSLDEDEALDNVYTLKIVAEVGAPYDAVALFYEHPTATTGSFYMLSLTIDSAVVTTIVVNGVEQDLVRGVNEIAFSYEETDEASLHIILGSEATGVVNNTYEISAIGFVEKTYDPLSAIVIDGALSDWEGTRASENTLSLIGNTEPYAHKSVTFYAGLDEDGLYVAAHAFHDLLIQDETKLWWQNTNLEFFINGGTKQYWVSADTTENNSAYDWAMVSTPLTGEGLAAYETIAEIFVPLAEIPANSILGGEIRVGFAWKTDGDLITGGEANGGGEDAYWVPAGTWPDNNDQPYVTYNGIFEQTQVVIVVEEPTLFTIDGDLTDWATEAAYTTNFVQLVGTDATAHKDVTFYGKNTDEGLYLAAVAHHDVFINTDETWWKNTNFEFFIEGIQHFAAANGAVAREGMVASIASVDNPDAGDALYKTVAEVFIPETLLGEATSRHVGFAWKTDGDLMTGGGGSAGAADAWWFIAGHYPTNVAEAYIVDATGISVQS